MKESEVSAANHANDSWGIYILVRTEFAVTAPKNYITIFWPNCFRTNFCQGGGYSSWDLQREFQIVIVVLGTNVCAPCRLLDRAHVVLVLQCLPTDVDHEWLQSFEVPSVWRSSPSC